MFELSSTDEMRLRVRRADDNQPSHEMTVIALTADCGDLNIVIHPTDLCEDDTIKVGWPAMSRTVSPVNQKPYSIYLIQLPRYSNNCATAIWVNENQLVRIRFPEKTHVGEA